MLVRKQDLNLKLLCGSREFNCDRVRRAIAIVAITAIAGRRGITDGPSASVTDTASQRGAIRVLLNAAPWSFTPAKPSRMAHAIRRVPPIRYAAGKVVVRSEEDRGHRLGVMPRTIHFESPNPAWNASDAISRSGWGVLDTRHIDTYDGQPMRRFLPRDAKSVKPARALAAVLSVVGFPPRSHINALLNV